MNLRCFGRRSFGVALVCWTTSIAASPAPQPAEAPSLSPEAVVTAAARRFEDAIERKDVEGVLALWRFDSAERRRDEELALRSLVSSDRVRVNLDAPSFSNDGAIATTLGNVVTITEPRGAVELWSLVWRRDEQGGPWKIVSRTAFDPIDGLVHLEIDSVGYRAAGQSIVLEDFRLDMTSGTFFLNTQLAGPTALVFVGEGRVTFAPPSETEQGQMRLFCGRDRLETKVDRAFLRLHPADLNRTLVPGNFTEDPEAARRFVRAREYFEEHMDDAFVLEAPVEGSPWWVFPGLSDAAVVFEAGKLGALTYTLSTQDSEGVSLFNRHTRRQITVYPRRNSVAPDDDAESMVDTADHDLSLRIDPETTAIEGESRLAIDIRGPLTSFRLRLDDALRVLSIRSAEAGRHLFFRIRDQNTILVSMGPLAGRVGRLNLSIRYAGRMDAGPIESEILQSPRVLSDPEEPAFLLDPVFIYTRRRAFYPQVGEEDYATWTVRVTTPDPWRAISSGERSEEQVFAPGATPSGRTERTVRYEQREPGKYIAILVSRVLPMASSSTTSGATLDVFAQSRLRRDAERTASQAREILSFYEGLFGPLPFRNLRIALVETPTPGGHSPPGFVILQQRPPLFRSGLRDDPAAFWDIPGFFLAHELAHQWWGQGVTPRSYRDRWISEGFAQYAAALWVRQGRGEEAFERVLRKMASWARRMTGQGPVILGNRVGHIRNDPQANRAIVYDKAALVLDMARRLLGDATFAEVATRVQATHLRQRVSTQALRQAFVERDPRLGALFDHFLQRTALPRIAIDSAPGGSALRVVGYDGPLPVRVRVRGRGAVVDAVIHASPFTIDARSADIEVDPGDILLAIRD